MKERAKIIVKGVVQGVGFRYFVLREAQTLHLFGEVRNLQNGNVKIIVEGEKSAILTLSKNIRIGPRYANVTQVDIEWQKNKNEYNSFAISEL